MGVRGSVLEGIVGRNEFVFGRLVGFTGVLEGGFSGEACGVFLDGLGCSLLVASLFYGWNGVVGVYV